MNIIDVFSGVGGFSLGAARSGFELKLAIDNDPLAIASHRINFPHSKHLETDLAEVSHDQFENLFEELEEIDGVIGGPPCQGFSFMGRRAVDDPRNNLFKRFFELVHFVQPKFFVAENVPGVMSDQYSSLRSSSFQLVSGRYDLFEPLIVKANEFGAATTRTRVFFIGVKKGVVPDFDARGLQLEKVLEYSYVKDVLLGLPVALDSQESELGEGWMKVDPPSKPWLKQKIMCEIPKNVGDTTAIAMLKSKKLASGFLATDHCKEVKERFGALAPGQIDPVSKMKRLDPNGWCPTIRAGTNSDKGSYQSVRPIHPSSSRVITTREAARLQGFPDWFQFHHTKWHSFRQIGNSVSPIVAELVMGRIRDLID